MEHEPRKFPREQDPHRPIVDPAVEEFILLVAQNEDIARAVGGAPNKLEAIRAVRAILPEKFPEIKEIPEAKPGPAQKPILGTPGNEFLIARRSVDLLWEEREK